MNEHIWIAELTAEQLMDWLATPRTKAPHAILERIDDIDFPSLDEAIALEYWPQGRIFGKFYELRWKRHGDRYHTRFTGEIEQPPPFVIWPGLGEARVFDISCYLWSDSDMRIGREMEYRSIPKGKGRIRLLRREFRQKTSGVLIADRLLGIERETLNESI